MNDLLTPWARGEAGEGHAILTLPGAICVDQTGWDLEYLYGGKLFKIEVKTSAVVDNTVYNPCWKFHLSDKQRELADAFFLVLLDPTLRCWMKFLIPAGEIKHKKYIEISTKAVNKYMKWYSPHTEDAQRILHQMNQKRLGIVKPVEA